MHWSNTEVNIQRARSYKNGKGEETRVSRNSFEKMNKDT
jgi:hypothetical protein